MAIGARADRLVALGAILAAAACTTPGPRPLAFGVEECARCHMTLADPHYAGELVTTTGKVIPFDDVGCLAAFVAAGEIAKDRIHSLWVHDFAQPDSMFDATTMEFLQHDSIRTPMDYGLVALRPGATADSLRARRGGRLLSWEAVLALTRVRPAR